MVGTDQKDGGDDEKWSDLKIDLLMDCIWGIREGDGLKLTPKFWAWTVDHSNLMSCVKWGGASFNVLRLGCLLDIQMKLSIRLLDMQIWNSGLG